jgi:hypothetical protein
MARLTPAGPLEHRSLLAELLGAHPSNRRADPAAFIAAVLPFPAHVGATARIRRSWVGPRFLCGHLRGRAVLGRTGRLTPCSTSGCHDADPGQYQES